MVVPYFLFAGRLMTKLAEQVERFSARYPWIRARARAAPRPVERAVRADRRARAPGARRRGAAALRHLPVPRADAGARRGGRRAQGDALQRAPQRSRTRRRCRTCTRTAAAQARAGLRQRRLRRRAAAWRCSSRCAGCVKQAGQQQRHPRDAARRAWAAAARARRSPSIPTASGTAASARRTPQDLVEEHLLGDRLVARLVDDIMQ